MDGERVPETTTVLSTPYTYSGPVNEVASFDDIYRLRAREATQAAFILPTITKDTGIEPYNQETNAVGDGQVTKLGGAESLYPAEETAALAQVDGTVKPVVTRQPVEPAADSQNEAPPPSPTGDAGTQGTAIEPPSTSAVVPPPTGAASSTEAANTPPPPPPSSPADAPQESTSPLSVSGGTQSVAPSASTQPGTLSGGLQGSTLIDLSSGPVLSSLTCVPMSLVVPSARPATSTADDVASETADASAPAQTENAASRTESLVSVYLVLFWAGLGLLVVG